MGNEEDVTCTSSNYNLESICFGNRHNTFIQVLNKFDEIQKEHKAHKAKNCLLKSDNTRLTREIKNLNSHNEGLDKLKAENKALKEECTSRWTPRR